MKWPATWETIRQSLVRLEKHAALHTHSERQKTSLVAQLVKSIPAMQDMQVRSLGQEDPLEKEMATHPGILAWRISWMEEPGALQSTGLQRVGRD